MKFAHVADLHLGKAVNGYSMLEEQRYILKQILEICVHEHVDAILMAGDIYDNNVPSEEAVKLLNVFLEGLQKAHIEVFLIAGNHDSGERLAFAAKFLDAMHVHMVGTYSESLFHTDMSDAYGVVHVWCLPFIRPADAVRYIITHAPIDFRERNILVAHQFVTGGKVDPDSSEVLRVGGEEQIDASVFAGFDYVALGHLHRPQSVKKEIIRYSGTPLKYSLGEEKQEKSLTLFSIEEKGNYQIRIIPLEPRRDMKSLRGTFQELRQKEMIEKYGDHYVAVTLTDEKNIPDAFPILKTDYPFLMQMEYDNERTRHDSVQAQISAIKERSPLELFADFYESYHAKAMRDEQKNYMQDLIKEVWEKSDHEAA